MSLMQRLRTLLFYLLLSSSSLLWCLLAVLIAPVLGFRQRYRLVIRSWCRLAVWLARVVARVDYRIDGLENIPAQPCVILAKHQSTWETFFLSALFEPLSQVIKRELLYVPCFGWALATFKPIAIDRSSPKTALRELARRGHQRLQQGCWVLIFPEGTRIPVGQTGKFSRGGAALAVNAGLPVLPIAHDAGRYWPKEGWAKYPGCIQVAIGEPMFAADDSPKAIAELNQRAEDWINARVAEMDAAASQAQPAHVRR